MVFLLIVATKVNFLKFPTSYTDVLEPHTGNTYHFRYFKARLGPKVLTIFHIKLSASLGSQYTAKN